MIICFEIWADYGHFSHPATIYSSLTYPIPPKTTVMGMLAAIVGLGTMDLNSDAINNYAVLNDIKYSVLIKSLQGKKNFVFNGIKNALPSINKIVPIQKIRQRKQFYRELLIRPSYEIYIDFTNVMDKDIVEKIIVNLKGKKSLYSLYLGTNFCLANFRYVGMFEKKHEEHEGYMDIDSFIRLPNEFKIQEARTYSDIRIPTIVEEGRNFCGFTDLLIETTGRSIAAKVVKYSRVNDKNLIFI